MSEERKRWTPERDQELRGFLKSGLRNSQIATEMGITFGAVTSRLSKLNLTSIRGKRLQSEGLKAARKLIATTNMKNARRRRLASKFPIANLSAVIAASNVQVTKLPPGVSLGWRPSWWKAFA
jgi:hypothetical protein